MRRRKVRTGLRPPPLSHAISLRPFNSSETSGFAGLFAEIWEYGPVLGYQILFKPEKGRDISPKAFARCTSETKSESSNRLAFSISPAAKKFAIRARAEVPALSQCAVIAQSSVVTNPFRQGKLPYLNHVTRDFCNGGILSHSPCYKNPRTGHRERKDRTWPRVMAERISRRVRKLLILQPLRVLARDNSEIGWFPINFSSLRNSDQIFLRLCACSFLPATKARLFLGPNGRMCSIMP